MCKAFVAKCCDVAMNCCRRIFYNPRECNVFVSKKDYNGKAEVSRNFHYDIAPSKICNLFVAVFFSVFSYKGHAVWDINSCRMNMVV